MLTPASFLHKLLLLMIAEKASDLHLSVGVVPYARKDGLLMPLGKEPLTQEVIENIGYSLLTNEQKQSFLNLKEIDLSFGLEGLARFRVNVYLEKGHMALAFRLIPKEIPTPLELNLPQILLDIIYKPQGLILITGPTGSGKSTTLAALLNTINHYRRVHIITLENPLEFVYENSLSLIHQREVGVDTLNFKEPLKYILRQDPDIVSLGELRDLESIEAALLICETGHLTFATLHTNSTVQTINRLIDVFSGDRQAQVRTQLSFVLEAVICQRLIPKIGGGRALALEIMIPNAAIRNLIRENKVHQIYAQLQLGRSKYFMQTMNQSLKELVQKGWITPDNAIEYSPEPAELQESLAGKAGK